MRKTLKLAYYYEKYCIDSNQILHNDGDHQVVIVGGPNVRPANPRWRTAAILKPLKCHIYATVWPTGMKFGTVIHFMLHKLKFGTFRNQNSKHLTF